MPGGGHEVLFTSKSAQGAPPEPGWARGNYAGNAGAVKFEDSLNGIQYQGGGGIICANWGAKLGQVTSGDGSAYTIMFNEVRVGVNSADMRGTWALGFPGASVTAGNAEYWDPGATSSPNDTLREADWITGCHHIAGVEVDLGLEYGMGCRRQAEDAAAEKIDDQTRKGQARSRHVGGVNACFADGSVRFIRNDVPGRVWHAMQTRDGDPWFEDKPYVYEAD